MDYLWRLNPGLGPAKSERHQRPGRMRHVRQPTREQSAHDRTAERLRTLQRGEPLDLPASDLPPWARGRDGLPLVDTGGGGRRRRGGVLRRRVGVVGRERACLTWLIAAGTARYLYRPVYAFARAAGEFTLRPFRS